MYSQPKQQQSDSKSDVWEDCGGKPHGFMKKGG